MAVRVLLIGDEMRDEYHFCTSTRMCPEAPVPILVKDESKHRVSFGGAALVRDNLIALGVDTVTVFGSLSTKERFYVGGHMVCRVDNDGMETYTIAPNVERLLPEVDVVVISDYCKGGVSEMVASRCINSGKPCFVDTKNHHIQWYAGPNVTLFPNEHEYAANVRGQEALFGLVVAKQGEKGCLLIGEDGQVAIMARRREVRDVCGAGDVFLAACVWAHLAGLSPIESARIANEAAGISVGHIGTYILPPADVEHLNAMLEQVRTVSVD